MTQHQQQSAPMASSMTHPDETIVMAHHLNKVYRTHDIEVPALVDVNLTIGQGEMVAIMGPSGCGKTTLLNCLAGLDMVDSGHIEIAGYDLATMSDGERTDFRAQMMGFIFQSFNLLPVLSALENVALPLLVRRETPRSARKRAHEMLAAVGMANRERHRPAELSGGQRQRVAIARALVNDPAIVWADEPTGNLDSEAAHDIMTLMSNLNRSRRQTFVIVTHAAEIGAAANRILTMRDGKIQDENASDSPRGAIHERQPDDAGAAGAIRRVYRASHNRSERDSRNT
ncbi:MAG TPA: ABC transporter ATP-binding protein [Ktedonobacterales bacterium]|nr:ABC transporter ATP-binding protein [Ktedonobacterales bacterium]